MRQLSETPDSKPVLSWHRPLMAYVAAMLVLIAVSAAGLALDDRILVGAPIWLKPFKFAVSFTLYATTLAWALSLLPESRPLLRKIGWWTGTAIAVLASAEWVVMLIQVVRGRMIHFNYTTALDKLLYNSMGFMIMLVWVATLVVAVLVMLVKPADRAVSWALRLGLGISLVGMGLAELMNLPTPDQQRVLDQGGTPAVIGGHSVGVPDGGPGMPITDWSTTGGDLRIPHFVGMHALQALPLLAILLGVLARRVALLRDAKVRIGLIQVGAAAYAGLVGLVTWQALRGQPLVHPDALTLAALALLLGTTAWGTRAVLAAGRRRAGARASRSCEAVKELSLSGR
ncbi:MAG TPA: hypothetical protein VM347_05915 [Nonomuraea sp.]|nr:hypothetical protein [Nonomuraea sp.]